MPASQLGRWSAAIVGSVGVAYVVTVGIGMALFGLREPIGDPILGVMEVLTLVSAVPTVVLMAAIHEHVDGGRKLHALIALCFAVLFAGLTCVVHFVELTAVRQLGTGRIAWPSAEYAAELLAWDLFLGLALVFASRALADEPGVGWVRGALLAAGALCLGGLVGPVTGRMEWQFVGVFGYAIVLPIASFGLARWFRGTTALRSTNRRRAEAG
ncbi:MAG: hypothetical protein KJZ74_15790 [Gemmatimonadales bacterium]|nr:hypothetical protein [Gemmatimonadales bacterium]